MLIPESVCHRLEETSPLFTNCSGHLPEDRMKFKNDEWLTDYINAVHITVRHLEIQNKESENITEELKNEADALIQDAILCNMSIEVLGIQNLTGRLGAEDDVLSDHRGPETAPLTMKTYTGDTRSLFSDYRFVCKGLEEFSLEDIIEEFSPYFSKIYPDIGNMRAVVTELFSADIERGAVRETKQGVYRHAPEISEF